MNFKNGVILFLCLFLTTPAVASRLFSGECATLFWNSALNSEGKGPALYFQWMQSKPEAAPHQVEVVFSNASENPQMPVIYRKAHLSTDMEFEKGIFDRYGIKIPEALVNLVKKVDEHLVYSRIGFGVVEDYNQRRKVFAQARMYDGSFDANASAPWLALEYMFQFRGISIKTSKYLDVLRRNHDQKIYELGRYNLDGEKEPRTRAQMMIDLFILRNFLDRHPDAIIFGHITDEFKLDIFNKKYGLEVFEEVDIPGTNAKEYVTTVKASVMAAIIRERLKLENASLNIPD